MSEGVRKTIRNFRKAVSVSFLLFLSLALYAQVFCEEEDRVIFDRYIATMKPARNKEVKELIIETARFFIGTPYVASTLEKEPEQLVINLREMDCSTLLENVICLVKTVQDDNPTFEGFANHLRCLRYRNGEIHDYTDRLHYTSDWIFENERKGWVKDITGEIGGKVLPLSLSFMSTHPDSYRQLKNNPERIGRIAAKEMEINKRRYYYIPKEEIRSSDSRISTGDMVGFVTSIGGLDLSHVGIIYKEKDQLTFIHASSTAKKVIINEESVVDYTRKIKSNKGIMIVRLLP